MSLFETSLCYALFDLPLTLAVVTGIIVLHLLYSVIRPMVEKGQISTEEWARMEDDSMQILARRDRVVEELRDLEFEAAMNKVEDKDYKYLWQKYETEALQLIQQLEGNVDQYREQIEAQVNAYVSSAQKKAQKKSQSNKQTAESVEANESVEASEKAEKQQESESSEQS